MGRPGYSAAFRRKVFDLLAKDAACPASRTISTSVTRQAQFAFWAFTKRAKHSGLPASMGRIGDCYDYSMIEAFWSRMQIELLDRNIWHTPPRTRRDVQIPRDLAQPQAPPRAALIGAS